jgi:hypothetical protein
VGNAKAMGPYGQRLYSSSRQGKYLFKNSQDCTWLCRANGITPTAVLTNALNYSGIMCPLMADPELGELVAKIDVRLCMNVGKANARGLWDAYFEIFTERLGAT